MAIADNVTRIRDDIVEAAVAVGRSPDEVTLMGVTKTRNAEEIEEVIRAGITILGENRVQEARDKIPAVTGDVRWEMIGHLQRNKVNQTVTLFDAVQSVDSVRLAEAIDRAVEFGNPRHDPLDVLIEVNTSGEDAKNGVQPDAAVDLVGAVSELPHLRVRGMMTIGRFVDDERIVRECFRTLRGLRDSAVSQIPRVDLGVLSMGMTGDFRWAIAEGSTLIRIGTAIFGSRT